MAAKLEKTRTPGIFNAHELPKTHELSIRNIEVVRERFLSVTRVAIETTVPPWAVFEPPPRRPARQRDR